MSGHNYIARTVDGLVSGEHEGGLLAYYRSHQDNLRKAGANEHEILQHDIILIERITNHIQNYSRGSA